MSQNLARLNMALSEGLGGGAEAAEASGGVSGAGALAAPLQRRLSSPALHLLHPELADGLGAGGTRTAWAPQGVGGGSALACVPAPPSPHAAFPAPGSPHAPARAGSELLQRRSGASASLQPILVGRSGAHHAGDARLPPSPSDAAAGTDLRRAALLRSLQRRTGTGSGGSGSSGSGAGVLVVAGPAPPHCVPALLCAAQPGHDVAMTPPTEEEPCGMAALVLHSAAARAARPASVPPLHALLPAPGGAEAWAEDVATAMSPPPQPASAPRGPPPPLLRLGPQWQPRG